MRIEFRAPVALALLVCTIPAVAAGQELPKPPTQLAKFRPLFGTWSGSGTTVPVAGADAMPWTATMSVEQIHDGFFVQENVRIEVGAPMPLAYRTIYGYDTENQRYVCYTVGNDGSSHFGEYSFPERGVLQMNSAGFRHDTPWLSRGIWRIAGRNRLTYRSEVAEGTGDMRVYVDGAFERADATPPQVVDASFIDPPVAPEMETLARRIAGAFDVKGSMIMMPGMPEQKIHGTETFTPILGGHAVHSAVVGFSEGEEGEYHADTFWTWNAHDRCYDAVYFDNMGQVGRMQARWQGDDALVTTWSGLMMGQPAVSSSVTTVGEHGPVRAVSHTAFGVAPPMKTFDSTYTRRGE
ncbi:MAG: DUF1579 family protein [Planctomycetes bacterium]|nr:DUF1579 family protein [Planctomycetota bacterium]